MKKRILSILLTVAMLVAMVPAIAVSASAETGTTYEVTTIADVAAFIADTTTKNVAGNTMKLMGDLDYTGDSLPVYTDNGTNYVDGMWTGLKANVDGNGHMVKVPGGSYYWGWILCDLEDGTDASNPRVHSYKNLKVVMDTGDYAYTGSFIGLFGRDFDKGNLIIENCYFDVSVKVTGRDYGSAVLFGSQAAGASATITATNTFFKMNCGGGGTGRHGVLVGRKFNAPTSGASAMTFNLNNCVFDSGEWYIIGQTQSNVNTVVTGEGNLILSGYGNGVHEGYTETPAGFTKVTAVENLVTTVKGYQTTTIANNKFNLRLVGLVELGETALTDYSKVGFVVVANYANTTTKWTSAASNMVYSSLSGTETDNTAKGETGIVTYEASDFGADYLYALAIKNIPANQGVITFEVTPYYIAADGTTVVYGATENFEIDPATLAENTLANG